jgi:TetR/AcrR family transcriptional regulator
MSYIAERRVEEKERRRAEIVDAAEKLYAEKGWDSVTMDQVAKAARLSRALLYVYFRDRDELQFAIGERALEMLRTRFLEAVAEHRRGLDQVEAIGRAYMTYAQDFPHYFDVCARFQAHSMSADPGSNEGACAVAGDAAISVVVEAIRTGIADGSIRDDIGDPMLYAVTLWAFTHGVIQLAMAKSADLTRLGISHAQFTGNALALLRSMGAPRPAG